MNEQRILTPTIGERQRTCPYHFVGHTYESLAELRTHQLACPLMIREEYVPDPLTYGWGLA